jgi:hypothetical protein
MMSQQRTLSPEGISTDPKKLKAKWELPTLKNKHEIRSFLSLCTYYVLADQTHREEGSLPVGFRSGGPLYCI